MRLYDLPPLGLWTAVIRTEESYETLVKEKFRDTYDRNKAMDPNVLTWQAIDCILDLAVRKVTNDLRGKSSGDIQPLQLGVCVPSSHYNGHAVISPEVKGFMIWMINEDAFMTEPGNWEFGVNWRAIASPRAVEDNLGPQAEELHQHLKRTMYEKVRQYSRSKNDIAGFERRPGSSGAGVDAYRSRSRSAIPSVSHANMQQMEQDVLGLVGYTRSKRQLTSTPPSTEHAGRVSPAASHRSEAEDPLQGLNGRFRHLQIERPTFRNVY